MDGLPMTLRDGAQNYKDSFEQQLHWLREDVEIRRYFQLELFNLAMLDHKGQFEQREQAAFEFQVLQVHVSTQELLYLIADK